MLETLPSTNIDLVKSLFSRVEAFDFNGVVRLFTDTPLYQFGNFEVSLDKAAIAKSIEGFSNLISAVSHEIKTISEVEDIVFTEIDVVCQRKDGSVVSVPCSNIFRLENNKFSEMRIFMDVNPILNPTIVVSPSASVFTTNEL